DKLFPLGVAAMLEAADLIVEGRHTETPQDDALATYEGWCKDPEARINWHAPVAGIYDLIRGCNPSPGAWTTLKGTKVRVFDARRHTARRFADVTGKPGEIISIGEKSIHVAAQGGALELLRVKADGGEKVSAGDLCRAHSIAP